VSELRVAVTPRAAADRVGPYRDGVLHVRVSRPPADGEANRVVLRLVARSLDVPPSSLRIVAGERGRRKRLEVVTLQADELQRRLRAIGAD
jgi:uncharacterized protein